jgi:RHS repeat-associated protein
MGVGSIPANNDIISWGHEAMSNGAGGRVSRRTRGARRMSSLVAVALVAGCLQMVFPALAEAQTEDTGPFAGVPGVEVVPPGTYGEVVSPDELDALPSDEPVELAPFVPNGDFAEPAPLEDGLLAGGDQGVFDESSELVDDLTTPTREVYENADGSLTAVSTAQPVRFEDSEGEWQDIDLTLSETPAGDIATEAAAVPVVLPKDKPGSVEVQSPAGVIAVSAPDVVEDPEETPALDGGTSVTEGDGGLAVQVDATVWGFEQSVLLPEAGAPASYQVEITLPSGLVARSGSRGVEFVDGAGELVSFFGGGLAQDSATVGVAEGAVASVVTSLVAVDGDTATVEIGVDAGWLADPARVFPVAIDPSFVGDTSATNGGADTWVQGNLSQSLWGHANLKVGSPNGTDAARSFLRFDLPEGLTWESTVVTDAVLSLHEETPTTCSASDILVYDIDTAFDTSTVWTNKPALEWGPSSGAVACNGSRVEIQAEDLVERWFDTTDTDGQGLALRAANETSTSQFKVFSSGDTSTSSQVPTLTVTYNQFFPSVPELEAPADEATLATLTPTLTADEVTDDDEGDTIEYWFRLWTGDDENEASGQLVDSGWIDEPEWTVPEGELVDGAVYRWSVSASDGAHIPRVSASRQLTTNLRLGSGGPSGFQTVGPVAVNLATGNANLQIAAPTLPTVGGGIGASFSYDSQAPTLTGLTGKYFNDSDENGEFDLPGDALVIERTDPSVAFEWGDEAPQPGMAEDDFLVRWRGQLHIPDTGSYTFGGIHDGGMRIVITDLDDDNETYTVLDGWDSATGQDETDWDEPITLNQGGHYLIRVDMKDTGGEARAIMRVRTPDDSEINLPSSWLRPETAPQDALPHGWSMSTALGGGGLTEARMINDVIIFRTASGGWCCAYVRDGSTWKPPPGGDSGTVSRSDSGRITLRSSDGTVYEFNENGSLSSARSPADSGNPAATTATYGTVGDLPRLMSLEDPVSDRSVDFSYGGGGGCPEEPDGEGFDSTVPYGMLCKIHYPAGGEVWLFYVGGQLARVRLPSEEAEVLTDMAYEDGLLASVRSPLAADAAAAGIVENDETIRTLIAYDDTESNRPKVTSVTLPEPTVDADRPGTSFTYSGAQTDVSTEGLTTTDGEPHGYSRRVIHDAEGQVTTETSANELSSYTTYDEDGHVLSVVDASGMQTNTVYDARDRVTDTWGPAPTSWFDGPGAPEAEHQAATAHSEQHYDEGVEGNLAANWWDNTGMSGPPDVFDMVGANFDFGSGGPAGLGATNNFSGRFTGLIDVPETGEWDFRFERDGQVRLTIDDELVIDEWQSSTADADGDAFELDEGQHRIMIEYAETTGDADMRLVWRMKDGTWPAFSMIANAKLDPAYSNVTSSTAPDGIETENEYLEPHLGALTSAAVDPAGADITASVEYEGTGTHEYRRRTTGVRPTGAETTTAYYGNGMSSTADNPCTSSTWEADQMGQPATVTGPDPDGSGPVVARVDHFVYDGAGRSVAEWVGSDPEDATCTTYDERGRPVTVVVPEIDGRPGRTTTTDYAVEMGETAHHPLVSMATDSSFPDVGGTDWLEGSTATIVDLLGRVTTTRDVWGNISLIGYDQAGRALGSTGIVGFESSSPSFNTLAYGFDALGRVDTVTYNGLVYAEVTYDGLGRVSVVDYPSGSGNGGNGTSLAPVTFDEYGRPDGVEWLTSAEGPLTANTRTYDVSGNAIDETIDGVDANRSGDNYLYDGIGRLTEAHIGGNLYEYEFSPDEGCGLAVDAGLNSNRSKMTVNNSTETYYCYDGADRLTETNGGGIGDDIEYDSHGNTTELGDVALGYDASDRHITTHVSSQSHDVTYIRDGSGSVVGRSADGEDPLRFSAVPAGVSLTMDASNNILETVIGLPGGASVTLRGGGEEVWSYPNLMGTVQATADEDGVKTAGPFRYDPFGGELNGIPDNREGGMDGGWMGSVGTEHSGGLELVEMGARVYSPLLGRFLQVDPVAGGSANDYDYANADPVNSTDRSGKEPIYTLRSYSVLHLERAAYLGQLMWTDMWRKSWGRSYARSAAYRYRANAAAQAMAYVAAVQWAAAVSYAQAMEWKGAAAAAIANANAVRLALLLAAAATVRQAQLQQVLAEGGESVAGQLWRGGPGRAWGAGAGVVDRFWDDLTEEASTCDYVVLGGSVAVGAAGGFWVGGPIGGAALGSASAAGGWAVSETACD